MIAVVLKDALSHTIHGILDTGLPPFGGNPLLGGADQRAWLLLHHAGGMTSGLCPITAARYLPISLMERIHTGCVTRCRR